MHITFGMSLDGSDWSPQTASLGEIKLGPLQFMAWLESRLGLDGIAVSTPERINEYMKKIRHVNPEWSKVSFELDSWSTAKQMLTWRDELFAHGWDGKSGSSERLKTLAAIEADSGPLSPGRAERIALIQKELQKYHFTDTLVLQDAFELLPYQWQQVINQLRQSGMKVSAAPPTQAGTPVQFQVNGANEFVLAQECVRFLAAGANKRTALICTGDSAILDGAFQRNGIGRLNAVSKSRWRESLQILPLWLETLWKPFNPQRFLELLLLPYSPIPKVISRGLINALQEAPGYGGEAWEKVWADLQKLYIENGILDSQNPDFKKIAAVWKLLGDDCFLAEESVAATAIIHHCDFLNKRIAVQIEHHPELALVVEQAQTLKKIVTDRTQIKRMELARILDSIISTGTTGEHDQQERTDFAVFANPGMIDRNFDTILWWNFTDNGTPRAISWTADEISVMPGYNRNTVRELENRSWHNALNHAEKNIIFFVPQMINGDVVFPHPLADELKIPPENILSPEKLTDSTGKWSLAGRTVLLEKQPLFEPATSATITPNGLRPTRRLSYSQLNTLITCPFQWFLNDYVGLKMPPAMTVPTGSQMLGTLAHKVVEEIYQGKTTLTVEEAGRDAQKKFDELLPAMAAELLLAGHNVERKRIRNILVESVKTLVQEINDRKLLVKGNEKELHGSFDGLDFIGYSDIYLEDAAGEKFVIDMKWSTSSYYEKNLNSDKALQLATYSWLLDPEALNVRCAYYLFPRKQLVCDPEKKWDNLWSNAQQAWAQRFAEIHSGELNRGIAEEKHLKDSTSPLPLTAGCAFCNYAALCAMLED